MGSEQFDNVFKHPRASEARTRSVFERSSGPGGHLCRVWLRFLEFSRLDAHASSRFDNDFYVILYSCQCLGFLCFMSPKREQF